MADIKKIATRDSYGATLVELADAGHNDIVVLDADLSASTRTAKFRDAYPDRFFNCGIAEQNMMGVAAGLASMGNVVFASSFAMFATGRAYDQIRNSIAGTKLNVKICASHAGLSVGEDGASHMMNEDLALMRAIPNMIVMNPADDVEARACVRAAYQHDGPVYIRLSRLATPVFHNEATYEFKLGQGEKLIDGYDIAIVATGLMVSEALKASIALKHKGVSARIISIPTIKPLDEDLIIRSARECNRVLTVEEHSIIGGLGEAVCSCLAEKQPTLVRRMGVKDVFGCSGPAWDVLKEYGLTSDDIVKAAMEMTSLPTPQSNMNQ